MGPVVCKQGHVFRVRDAAPVPSCAHADIFDVFSASCQQSRGCLLPKTSLWPAKTRTNSQPEAEHQGWTKWGHRHLRGSQEKNEEWTFCPPWTAHPRRWNPNRPEQGAWNRRDPPQNPRFWKFGSVTSRSKTQKGLGCVSEFACFLHISNKRHQTKPKTVVLASLLYLFGFNFCFHFPQSAVLIGT